MKNLSFLLLVFAALVLGSHEAAAQSGVETDGRRVIITNSEGEDVMKIFADDDEGNTVISFSSFNIFLNGAGSPMTRTKKSRTSFGFGSNNYMSFFEIGMNTFPSVDYSLYGDNLPVGLRDFMDLRNAKSLQFNFALFRMAVYLNESKTLAFSTGLQLCFNEYVFSGNVMLAKVDGMLIPQTISPHYKKSKMTTSSFQIPLLLSVGKTRAFHFSAGVYGGVIIGSHTKIKFPKEKMYDLYMRPFYGGVTARAGYRGFYLYANYGLSEMFKQGKGPETAPLTIGLGLGF